MDKFERILEIPACYITKEVGNHISERIYEIVEERAKADYTQVLGQLALHLNLDPEEILTRLLPNTTLRDLLGVRKDRTTFISPHGNVQYVGRDVLYDEIPMDLTQVIIDVPGLNGKYLSISLAANLMQNFPLHGVNKILIQAKDRAWVNHLYQEFQTLLLANKKIFRDFIYRWLRPIGFLTFFVLSFIEFWIYQVLHPTFTIQTPLTGLAVIIVFFLLSINHYIVFQIGARILQYSYPYFELEDRLSERRKDWRKFLITTLAILYGIGLKAGFALFW